MYIVTPGGPLAQLSNLSFFAAAIFGDVLLIRLFLTLAYVFLFAQAMCGQPRWPSVTPTGALFLDTVLWAAASGTLHLVALVRLLLDERPVRFKTPEEEQLWRFFYRRSGMGRLEMSAVLRYGRWRHVAAGDVILDPLAACSRLCLMVQGVGEFAATTGDPEAAGGAPGRAVSSRLLSGAFFDMRLLNVFGLYVGFEGSGAAGQGDKWFAARAVTDCTVYEWSIEELDVMATALGPAVSHCWRNLTATQTGLTLAWREAPQLPPTAGCGEPESPAVLAGARSRDFTDPLRRYERQRGPDALGALRWLWRSLHPLMPPGVRHNDLPVHGVLARNRIVALKESQLRAAAREAAEGAWRLEEERETVVATLRKLESLRVLERTDAVRMAKDLSVRRGRAGAAALARARSDGAPPGEGSVRSDPGPVREPGSP